MKKTLCLMLVFIGLFSMASAEPLETDLPFELETPSYLLMEQETGQVILEHNADERRPVASVTKLMTLLLIFEALEAGSISLNDQLFVLLKRQGWTVPRLCLMQEARTS